MRKSGFFYNFARLTPLEKTLKVLGGVVAAPFGFASVPEKHVMVVSQFGKLDRVCEPGLRWVPPMFADIRSVFMGARSHRFDDMHIIDCMGTPIVVSVVMRYAIANPEQFVFAARASENVVLTLLESTIREQIREYPMVIPEELNSGDYTHCIQRDGSAILNFPNICTKYEHLGAEFGVKIGDVSVVKTNYAPEIAQHMLMKQQAQALVNARSVIVKGVMGMVNDAAKELTTNFDGSEHAKFVTNMAVALSSGQGVVQVQPTLQ
jgi:regulator of protease activity HflC (stomatin/prohibitin superfamily)